jgi:hypothetical protein
MYIKPQTALPANVRINKVDAAARVVAAPSKGRVSEPAGFRCEERVKEAPLTAK